jgi:hypothetical protein
METPQLGLIAAINEIWVILKEVDEKTYYLPMEDARPSQTKSPIGTI